MRATRWGKNLAALGVGVFAALFLGEIGARLLAPAGPGKADRLAIDGMLTIYDPLLGFRLRPYASAELSHPDFDISIATNSRGLRESEEVPYVPASSRRRILLCGDSFTFGHGVDEEDRYGERLAVLLDSVDVINQGVYGTGTDQQLLLYREEGVKYQPDLVILAYFVENILRNATTARFNMNGEAVHKPRFILENGQLVLTGVPVPKPGAALDEERTAREYWDRVNHRFTGTPALPFAKQLREHSALYGVLRRRTVALRQRFVHGSPDRYPEYGADREEWAVTREILRAFAEEARSHGSDFLLVIIPESVFVNDDRFSDEPFSIITEFAREEGIPVLDLLPAFERAARSGRRDLYFKSDGHWTPRGHALGAEEIATYLAQWAEWNRVGAR